jgi:hypothetical protein
MSTQRHHREKEGIVQENRAPDDHASTEAGREEQKEKHHHP